MEENLMDSYIMRDISTSPYAAIIDIVDASNIMWSINKHCRRYKRSKQTPSMESLVAVLIVTFVVIATVIGLATIMVIILRRYLIKDK